MIHTPNSLHPWQAQFIDALRHRPQAEFLQTLDHDSVARKTQRFSIYQNNVFYSLSQALADLYPVIYQLTGHDFFMATARQFLHQHLPTQAAMVYFGHTFADFLQQFEHSRCLPYLADMARLELARHLSYHAKDCSAVCAQSLAAIDSEQLAAMTIPLHPAVQLVRTSTPCLSLWQAHQVQPVELAHIDLNQPQQVLISRPEYRIQLLSIDLGTWHFFDSLHRRATLGDALTQGYNQDKQFDPSRAIALALEYGCWQNLKEQSVQGNNDRKSAVYSE